MQPCKSQGAWLYLRGLTFFLQKWQRVGLFGRSGGCTLLEVAKFCRVSAAGSIMSSCCRVLALGASSCVVSRKERPLGLAKISELPAALGEIIAELACTAVTALSLATCSSL